MLLRILTFFKWVYGNPLTFLVGIRRIPAYHVDYTTGPSSSKRYTVSTPDVSGAARQNTIELIIIRDAVYTGCGAA